MTPLNTAIAAGTHGMAISLAKAESAGFSTSAAREFVLAYLRHNGPSWGEVIVVAAAKSGLPELKVRDGRCWGGVFKALSVKGHITCIRSDGLRLRGHGTSGGRLWDVAERLDEGADYFQVQGALAAERLGDA